MSVQKLVLPLRAVNGRLVTVMQDSAAEIDQCVEAILRTHSGDFLDHESMGIPDDTFLQGGPRLDLIREAVERDEPRARFLTDVHLTQLVATVTAQIGATRG